MKIQHLETLHEEWQNSNQVERFGQYVINRTPQLSLSNPRIFYETNHTVAYAKLAALCEETQLGELPSWIQEFIKATNSLDDTEEPK